MNQYTFADFQHDYPDEDACLDALFQTRAGHLKTCPHCGTETKFYRLKHKKAYACGQPYCGFAFSPTAGLIVDRSSTPLTKWFYALYLFSAVTNVISAAELQRRLGVTYKTAWRMRSQIRRLIQQAADHTAAASPVAVPTEAGRPDIASLIHILTSQNPEPSVNESDVPYQVKPNRTYRLNHHNQAGYQSNGSKT